MLSFIGSLILYERILALMFIHRNGSALHGQLRLVTVAINTPNVVHQNSPHSIGYKQTSLQDTAMAGFIPLMFVTSLLDKAHSGQQAIIYMANAKGEGSAHQ